MNCSEHICMTGFLLQLLYLPARLVLLPFKLARTASTFITCVAPLLVVLGIVGAIVWFLFIR